MEDAKTGTTLADIWAQSQSQTSTVGGSRELPTDSNMTESVDNVNTDDTSLSPLEELERRIANGDVDENEEASQGDEESETSLLSSEEDSDSLLNNLDSKKEPASSTDIETAFFKDENGRKQKLKIDYTDRKIIKQRFLEAAAMRRFQVRGDEFKNKLSEAETKFSELNDVYSKLDTAFQQDGVKGVVSLLGQGENAWADAVDAELRTRDYLSNLTPNEKYQLEMEEFKRTSASQLAAERTKREQFEQQIAAKEEQAELRSLESKLNPAFDRYRFAGKLNDSVIEEQLDEAIWTKVTNRLSEYPDDVELTQAIVDKEFRQIANNYRKIISKESEKTVKKTIEKKKTEASQRAQVAARKGLTGSNATKKFVEDIKGGDLASAWSSFMSGNVKL